MDAFAHLVKHRETAPRKIKVHKTYINEDPNEEVETSCPKCWSRNQQSTVRYMYINMNEAIYKCEAANCMYPFRDFKYKNYVDNTVYYYTALDVEEPAPALDEFAPSFLEPKGSPSPVKPCNTSMFDFNLECFSPEKATSGASVTLSDIKTPDRNIFDSPSIRNLVKDFDTGFIDDILSELGSAPGSPEKKPSPIARVAPPKPPTSNKQLKRCLQMFQQTATSASQSVFKVPPLPGKEPTISPKQKSHRKSPGGHHRRHKHSRRPKHQSPSPSATSATSPALVTMSAGQLLQKSRMKPLQFIESLNSIKPLVGKEPAPAITGIQRLGNQKVERMLNFIERSMKKREPSPAPTQSVESSPERPTWRPIVSKRKEPPKKLSLSAAVLQDTQFQYDSADEPVSDGTSPVKSEVGPVKEEEATQVVAPAMVGEPLLPSFGELLDFIHPPEVVEPRWRHQM